MNYETEAQCRSDEDKDLVLERGADGKVTELVVTEEDQRKIEEQNMQEGKKEETDADNHSQKQ